MLYSSGLLRIGVRIDFAKNSARRQRRHVGIGLLEYAPDSLPFVGRGVNNPDRGATDSCKPAYSGRERAR